MRFLPVLTLALLLLGGCVSRPLTDSTSPVASGDYVQDKNFYLLTLLAQDPTARAALAADAPLAALGARLHQSLADSWQRCKGKETSACVVTALQLGDTDISLVAERLAALARPGQPLQPLVATRMRPSGRFARHAALDDAGLIAAAWRDTAAGVNRLYRVYGLAEKPRYPDIDAISYDPASNDYATMVRAMVEIALDEPAADQSFFSPWLRVGLDYLTLNQRDEAGRYEPMELGVNAAALKRAAGLDWQRWSYTAILIPGAGTLAGEVGLSAAGELRVRLAARRYHAGLAPLMIVSGGHVHPNKTPFAEAVEMKKRLVERYGVPANAVLIDPHARHTTTNLRNAVRLLVQAGAPLDRNLLISTDNNQSAYIESEGLMLRCERELGYRPMLVVKRLNAEDLVMSPQRISLQQDPQDPLDP